MKTNISMTHCLGVIELTSSVAFQRICIRQANFLVCMTPTTSKHLIINKPFRIIPNDLMAVVCNSVVHVRSAWVLVGALCTSNNPLTILNELAKTTEFQWWVDQYYRMMIPFTDMLVLFEFNTWNSTRCFFLKKGDQFSLPLVQSHG